MFAGGITEKASTRKSLDIFSKSIYAKEWIENMAQRLTKVILFRHHFHFENPVPLDYLLSNRILSGAPQSIVEIPHSKYLMIKRECGIDERFTVD